MDTQQHMPAGAASGEGDGLLADRPERAPAPARLGLGPGESFLALVVFGAWLVVFAGGIVVDTRPYRYAISEGGITALEGEAVRDSISVAAPAAGGSLLLLLKSWLVVLIWFLPINLALLCAISGTLGAFGSRANLQDDQSHKGGPADNSNPYVSALLRGFFVYLVMISGLLLLDDDPFSNPSPGQYIRLAGFLSLFSFVVNYHPQVFGKVLLWAVERIEARGEDGRRGETAGTEVHYAKATTVEVASVRTGPEVGDAAAEEPPRLPATPPPLPPPHEQPFRSEDLLGTSSRASSS